MKATYKEIKQLIDNTNWDYNEAFTKRSQPDIDELGYFAPSGANWAYRLGIAKGEDDKLYFVCTVFGQIKGFRKLHI